MFIRCKDDLHHLIKRMKKEANEVNGTYEFIGTSFKVIGGTEHVKDVFDISDKFEREFIESISTFKKREIGPYITEKYFMLIPCLKEALRQMKDDCLETRRCIINFPSEHCFQSIQFLLRENTIHVVCYMRSCDAIRNLPYDVWICSKMADIFSKHLSDTLGEHPYNYHAITMMFGSLHVYKKDLADVF